MARPVSQGEVIDNQPMQKAAHTLSYHLLNSFVNKHIPAQVNRDSSPEEPETPKSKPKAKDSHLWRLVILKRHIDDWQPELCIVR